MNKYERHRAYQEKYRSEHREEHRASQRAYIQTPAGKETKRRADDKRAAERPEKDKARVAVRHALESGRLTEGPCEHLDTDCSSQIEAHHWSYLEEHWLDVRWLCSGHHRAHHAGIHPL